MKVLGISASPRKGQTTDQLVKEILKHVDGETEFISLSGKKVSPCIGCLGCASDNICKIKDDMATLRDKVLEADCLVIGSPNYYGGINSQLHAFWERFYQFRHRGAMKVAGKKAVIVGVGGAMPDAPVEDMRRFLTMNNIELVGTIAAQGVAGCFTCGYGEDCTVGAIHGMFGAGTKITEEIIPSLQKQEAVLDQAEKLGKLIGKNG